MHGPATIPLIETPRLRLRPYVPGDAPDVQRLAGDPAVARTTLLIPHPYPDGAAAAWIGTHAAQWTAQESLVLAITLRRSGELLGSIGLVFQVAHEKADLGYWIGVPYWNQGYTTEAVRAVLDYGFRTLGLNRIEAHYMAHNPASGRVMEKAGLRREGLIPQGVKKDGVFRDVIFHGILRRDWAG
jgi:RimJ/RimL family protein N-acetyltransferase